MLDLIALDLSLFRDINGLTGHRVWLDALGIFAARWLIFVIAAAAAWPLLVSLVRRESRREVRQARRLAFAALLATIMSFGFNWIVSLIRFRHRPFAVLPDVHLLVPTPLTAHSFPSSHSAIAFALAFAVLLARRSYGLALLVPSAWPLGASSSGCIIRSTWWPESSSAWVVRPWQCGSITRPAG